MTANPKRVEMKSDWSTDSDNQARKKPTRHDVTSDWETEIKDGQEKIVEAPLRRPNTMPKVFTGRIRKYPLANWTSVIKGQENNPHKDKKNDGHDSSNIPFQEGNPDAERNSVMMASINRSQTYPPVLPPHRTRKKLAKLDLGRLRKSKSRRAKTLAKTKQNY